MKSSLAAVLGLALMSAVMPRVNATAPLNNCNAYGECRARLVSVYTHSNVAYVVLQGHILPSTCTNAAWGYYWTVPLSTDADRARYSTLLAAYLAQEVVEIRALDSACTVMASNVGE